MHGAALIRDEMQCKCVALDTVVHWVWVCPYTFLHRNQSARLVQAQVKSSNLEHVVRCGLTLNFCNVVVDK